MIQNQRMFYNFYEPFVEEFTRVLGIWNDAKENSKSCLFILSIVQLIEANHELSQIIGNSNAWKSFVLYSNSVPAPEKNLFVEFGDIDYSIRNTGILVELDISKILSSCVSNLKSISKSGERDGMKLQVLQSSLYGSVPKPSSLSIFSKSLALNVDLSFRQEVVSSDLFKVLKATIKERCSESNLEVAQKWNIIAQYLNADQNYDILEEFHNRFLSLSLQDDFPVLCSGLGYLESMLLNSKAFTEQPRYRIRYKEVVEFLASLTAKFSGNGQIMFCEFVCKLLKSPLAVMMNFNLVYF